MATTANIQQTVSPADALWSLFMSQTKAVKDELRKRFLVLNKEEIRAKRLKKYEASLTPAQREKALEIANSISIALKDAQRDDYEGTPIDEFLQELSNEG